MRHARRNRKRPEAHHNSLKTRFEAFGVAGPRVSPPPGRTWEELMSVALTEARGALALGEVPVGALVVTPEGQIIGSAGNRVISLKDPTAHAEILAVREAARRLDDERLTNCALVVTLEPCQMCAGALAQARLAGVVYGAADRLAGAVISRADFVSLAPKAWSLGGVLGEECAALLKNFFVAKRRATT